MYTPKHDPLKKATQKEVSQKFYLKLGIVFVVIIVVLSVGGYFFFKHEHAVLLKREFPVTGVTINQDDGYVDFVDLKNADKKFVYIKATQGASYVDNNFVNNYNRSQGSGLAVGIFHQYGFESSIKSQEHNFVKQVKNDTGNLPIVLQIQYYYPYNSKNINVKKESKRVSQFVKFLRNKYQQPVIIATNKHLYNAFKGIKNVKFWLNDYNSEHDNNVRFVNLDSKDSLTIDGNSDDYDLVAFNGSYKKWKQYLNVLDSFQ